MLLTIALILLATIAVAALEVTLFWQMGERDDRRRARERASAGGSQPVMRRPTRSATTNP